MVLYVPSAKGMQGFATYPLSHVIVFPERRKMLQSKEKKRKKSKIKKEKDSLPGRVRVVCWVGGRIFSKEGRPDSGAWSRNVRGGCQRTIHAIY